MTDKPQDTLTKPTTWGELIQLPEAPRKPPEDPETTFKSKTRGGLEGVWKGSGKVVTMLQGIVDLETLRYTLRISQPAFGKLLADRLGRDRPFSGSTVSAWEYAGRLHSAKARAKWGPTAEVVEGCRLIVEDMVALCDDRLRVKATLKKRVWSFAAVADCRDCGRPFTLKTSRSKTCDRCLKSKKNSKGRK